MGEGQLSIYPSNIPLPLPLPSASMFLRLIAPTNQPEEGLRACRNLRSTGRANTAMVPAYTSNLYE